MKRTGVHHLGLATLDIDKTIEFYTTKLGWEVAWCDIIEGPQGGKIKHAFINTGDGSLIAFMCPENMPGIPTEWATDINSAQGLPGAFYHFAFHCDDVKELEAKREMLIGRGVEVTPVVDHEWCRSIYFRDPNGLLLEYCTTVREFTEEDKIMRHHDQPGPMVTDPADKKKVYEMLMGPQGNKQAAGRTPV
ncbi:MAG TPA: VOC family protein [Candidatus Acidoferrales bacterium]|nr:VOC family protein [Candidatus Acidoferrales bacterium]